MDSKNGNDFICLSLSEKNPVPDDTDSIQCRRCRLCVSREDGMISIFSAEGKELQLAYKINKLLPTMVTPMDRLPQNVCSKCITDLNAAFEFVKKCMQSQTKLRKIIQVNTEDHNVPSKVIQDYSAHWRSLENSIENIRILREQKMRRSKTQYIQRKKENIGETENNGQLKKIKLVHTNKHCNKQISCKTLDNVDTCVMEINLPSSNMDPSNDDNSVDSDSLSKNISTVKAVTECTSEKKSEEGHASVENKSAVDCKNVCKYCEKSFPWKADLFDHQTSVHSDVVFRCSYCLKVFYDKNELESHELAHVSLLPPGYKVKKPLQSRSHRSKQGEMLIQNILNYGNEIRPSVESERSDESNHSVSCDEKKDNDRVCNYCNVTFTSLKMYRKHMRWEHQFRLPCRFCPTTCSSSYELNRHESKHHKKPKRYLVCKKCERNYDSFDELREHELIHMHMDGLKCEICAEAFTSEVSLEEHIKSHCGESSYLCETCGQNFESFFIFRIHKMSHMYLDFQKCELCNSCFHGVADLENHLEVVHKKKKYQCKSCEETFPSIELLKEHKVTHKTEFKCEPCGKTFTTAKKLKSHAQTHTSERNYLCEKCGKDFKLNSSLHKHRYLCQVAVACNLCNRKFDCNTRLKIHMRMHTGEKPHVCAVCNKGFHATWALNQHMATHNTVKIPCPICGTQFNRKANMVTHMMRHRVPCDTCGQVFANTPLLLAHQKVHVENGERPADNTPSKSYKCDDCGKLFVTSLDLKAHLPSHSEECPHTCDGCGRGFRRLKALKKHMMSHGGHKAYQCRFCTCTFVVHQRLLKHENGHTAGKPYVCQMCGQGFWSPLNLEKHSLKHSANSSAGQKFNCNYCDLSFAQKSSLIIHKRTHTAQLTYSCSYCPRKFSQLRFMQRHKCALNPNLEGNDSSLQKGLLPSLPTLNEEPSRDSDNICPVSVLNEEIVYDMDTSASYAEIIVISQNMDEFIVDNNSELNK